MSASDTKAVETAVQIAEPTKAAHPKIKKTAAACKLIFGATQLAVLTELITQVSLQILNSDDDSIKGARQSMYDWLKENSHGKTRFAVITGASGLKAVAHLIEFLIANKGHLKESLKSKAGVMLSMNLWEGLMLSLTTLLTNIKEGKELNKIAEALDIIPFKTMILGFALSIGPNMLFKMGTGLKELIQNGRSADPEKVLVGVLSLVLFSSYLGFIFPTQIATSATLTMGGSTVLSAGSLAIKMLFKVKSMLCGKPQVIPQAKSTDSTLFGPGAGAAIRDSSPAEESMVEAV